MKRSKKVLLFAAGILILIVTAGTIYLNNVILPSKIKSLIIRGLEETTQKNILLGSLRFNLFKGLVLRNLVVYDEKEKIINLKEGSCSFFLLPIFKKKLVISNLKLKSLEIFLERKADQTYNLQELFLNLGRGESANSKKPFNVLIYKMSIAGATIHFQDNTFAPVFTKDIEDLNLTARLSLPAGVKFSLSARIPALTSKPMFLNAAGEWKIAEQILVSKIVFRDFSAGEFMRYYQDWGVVISEGLADVLISLEFKEDVLYADLEVKNQNLAFQKQDISGRLNSDIKASLLYNLHDKQLGFSGKAKILDAEIKGLKFLGSARHISGELVFSDTELFSDNLQADILGNPLQAKVALADFKNPQLRINLLSKVNLESLLPLLKDEFKVSFIKDIKGKGDLSLSVKTRLAPAQELEMSGFIDISDGQLSLEKLDAPMESIKGRLEFSESQVKCPGLDFKYQEVPYNVKGALSNFLAPEVLLTLSSKELSLDSDFFVNNKIAKFSKCAARYRHSDFSFTGSIDIKDLTRLKGTALT